MKVPFAGAAAAVPPSTGSATAAPPSAAAAPANTAAAPVEDAVAQMYVAGHPISDICRAFALPRVAIVAMLNRPDVKFAMHTRLSQLQFRALEFKLRAFEGAEDGLELMHQALGDAKVDMGLKRAITNDLARLASLEPRRTVELRDFQDKGITEDVRDMFKQVLDEARGIVQLGGDAT
jgi:hypothetical protein